MARDMNAVVPLSSPSLDNETLSLEGAPGVDIQSVLNVMVEHDASDLYLTVNSVPRYRVDGRLQPIGERRLGVSDLEVLARSTMSIQQWESFRQTREMNLALSFGRLGRFRVNAFRQRGSVSLVIRKVDLAVASFEELGLSPSLLSLSMQKRGLILVVGGTGSGKSTTLAAMIDYRNRHDAAHILTIEDPIEILHSHHQSLVHQREVGFDTDSFQCALQNAMRQAPDVILIGEIRNRETMDAAITFADTGHLCLATLHSTNAYQSFERILNFFPYTQHDQILLQLSLNLRAILSQRLVVQKSGLRVPALEIMLDTPRIKDLIKKGEIESIRGAMEQGVLEGCQTFDMALYDLYQAGVIDLDHALSNAESVNNLRLRLKVEDTPKAPANEPSEAAAFHLQAELQGVRGGKRIRPPGAQR